MKLNWINKLLLMVNIAITVILLLASLSPSVEPQSSNFIYILSLAYPLFLLINILFILYWMYFKKIYFILSLVVVLFGYSNLSHLVSLNLTSESKEVPEFSIMSFNVRLFNRYNWIEAENLDQQILDYISKESPDIIAFQEFINSRKDNFPYIKKMKALGYPYFKVEPRYSNHPNGELFGLVTFSKFKIKDSGVVHQYDNGKGKSSALFTDIDVKGKLIRVFNTHLKSLRFLPTDYDFVENISENNEKEVLEKSKSIFSKVMNSALKRDTEVDHILLEVDSSPYPVIVLGDFNEPPYSHSYPQFIKKLKDPFLKFGFGLGTTYDGISTIPGLRLDYILHDQKLVATGFISGPSHLSDHRPLISWFRFTE
jgi:endonuclease/exonuclease/phosphatase (EEP) superfamily protein YafD